jgi:hypothetical protein
MRNIHVATALQAFAKNMPNLFGKDGDKGKPTLDFSSKLHSLHGLGDIPSECWPCNGVVVDMMKDAEKQKKAGVAKPYVFVDLSKFTPLGCMHDTELLNIVEEEYEEGNPLQQAMTKALGLPEKPKKSSVAFMYIGVWHAAFDTYALAAAVTGQWSMAASWAHKTVVNKIVLDPNNRKAARVGVAYDRLYRTRMAAKVAAKAPGFDQDEISMAPDRDLLEAARNIANDFTDGKVAGQATNWTQQQNGPQKAWNAGWSGQENNRKNDYDRNWKGSGRDNAAHGSKWEERGLPWMKKQNDGDRGGYKRSSQADSSVNGDHSNKRQR